jgi:hypothetical protein
MRFFTAALLAAACFDSADSLSAPPHIVVDLGLPPAARWNGALEAVLAAHDFEEGFLPTFVAYNSSIFDRLTAEHWATLATAMRTHWADQADELAFIASRFAANGHPVSFEYLCGWVFMHELAHSDLAASSSRRPRACTGIVAQRGGGGAPMHVANMDQSPPTVRNVTLRVTFQRSGVVVAEAVDWYWFTTGLTRMVRKGVASLQENWRFSDPPLAHDDVLRAIASGATPHVFYARQALLRPALALPRAASAKAQANASTRANAAVAAAATYDATLAYLASLNIAAPFYVVIAGPAAGQGAIVTRGAGTELVNITTLAPARAASASASAGGIAAADGIATTACVSGTGGAGYLVQTNYEPWLPDSASDARRTAVHRVAAELGLPFATTPTGLYALASAFPVHNPHTAYTALMSASDGTMHAVVREALCPVDAAAAVVHIAYSECGSNERADRMRSAGPSYSE